MLHAPRTSIAAAATIALGALLLTGCGPGGSSGDGGDGPSDGPTRGGTITVGGLSTSAIDPGQLGYSSQSNPWARQIFGTLFEPAEERGGDYLPGIAEGYEYNEDGTVLTFHLREGGKFSDGTTLDADAVVWNLNRHLEPGMREGQYFTLVTDISAVDEWTVQITFSEPYGLFMDAVVYNTIGWLASPTAFDEMGADAFNAAPVGAGPFMIETAEPGQRLELVRNDNFWDAEHVYLDGVTFTSEGTDEQAALVGLQSGSIQSINFNGTRIAPPILQAVDTADNLNLLSTPNTYSNILPMNTFSPPFDDLRARQAVAYCVDRESIAKNASQGYTTPAYVLVGADNTVLDGWEEGKKLNPYHHDPEKAAALVEELGGLSFTIITNFDATVVRALQQQLIECGMDAELTFTNEYLSLIQNGNYDIAVTINVNTSLNPALTGNYLDPDSVRNKFGWRDDGIKALIDESRATLDQEKFGELWREIWTKLSENVYVMPLISSPYYVVVSSCLEGVDTDQGVGYYANAYLTC